MTAAPSTVYRYLPIDCDHDITADTVEVSLDQATWVAASHCAAPGAAAGLSGPAAGFARYWVRVLTGPAQPLAPSQGWITFYGRVTDTPEIPVLAWSVNVA